MKHSFIDKYSDRKSPVHRIDQRVKLITVFLFIFLMVSEQPGKLYPFAFYGLLALIPVVISGVPLKHYLYRCYIVSPFIIVAAIFYPLSAMITPTLPIDYSFEKDVAVALSILLKAYLSVIMLTMLTATERFHNILLGLRQLKMPKLLGIVASLMYRYIFIISDEVLKTTRARESRTPGKITINKFRVYGNQMAMVFLRSIERSRLVYKAMLARGFTGEFPVLERSKIRFNDILFSAMYILAGSLVRLTI